MHDVVLWEFPPPRSAELEHFEAATVWYFGILRWLWTHLTIRFGLFPGLESGY